MLSVELFAELVADQAASDHPWSAPARRWGMLPVFNQLWETHLLTLSGDVFIDRDEGVLSPASPEERMIAHIRAARRYPQLHHLMPQRPPTAQACRLCHGSGEIVVRDGRRLVCGPPCNGKGWIINP